MPDLNCDYLGLKLKNPIIVGACGLTGNLADIEKISDQGVGAIVLKSLFEEQIINEIAKLDETNSLSASYFEGAEYLEYYIKEQSIDSYLQLISDAKKKTELPIIASINCITGNEWAPYAKRIEDAGADALELNIFIMPSDVIKEGREIEARYYEIIESVSKATKLPLSIKIGSYFSGLANFVQKLSYLKSVKGVVIFNRYFSPDIDLEKVEVISGSRYSKPDDISLSIRWAAMLSGKLDSSLCATTGVHDGYGVVKCLLAGADAVQVVSSLYLNGIEVLGKMKDEIEEWMNMHNFSSINGFKGKLSHAHARNPLVWERNQFIKYFSNAE